MDTNFASNSLEVKELFGRKYSEIFNIARSEI